MKQFKTIDGFLHTWISAAIAAIVTLICFYFFNNEILSSCLIGFIFAFVIGLIKEFIHDRLMKKSVFSLADIFADFIGSVMGSTVTAFIIYNLN